MPLTIPTTQPFSFAQTLAFARRFPACQTQCVIGDSSITAPLAIDGRPIAFTLRAGHNDAPLIELPPGLSEAARQTVIDRARRWIGADDNVAAFYAAAEPDARFQPIVQMLHGLHHLRFLTLAEITVYSVLMQRTPARLASASLGRFLSALGKPIDVPERTLFAMLELVELCELTAEQITEAIRSRSKAERIVEVVRGVAAIGEETLRHAPYAEARDALLSIRGLGPFSAGAILLRGLGRMDELPWMPAFEEHAREVYGRAVDHATIAKRYGKHIGYWSYYLMTGVPRLEGSDSRNRRRSVGASTVRGTAITVRFATNAR